MSQSEPTPCGPSGNGPASWVPAFFTDSSVRRCGGEGRFLLGGSPIRLFSLTSAGAALMDRIELHQSFDASPAEGQLIRRWLDVGVLHPRADLSNGVCVNAMITLVIPVRDRAAGVERLLASVAADYAAGSLWLAEIIIVDDGSTELFVVQFDQALLPPTRVIRCEQSGGPALARNLGLAQVETEFVAFVDSDCAVTLGWLDPLMAQFGDPSVMTVGPRVAAVAPAAAVVAVASPATRSTVTARCVAGLQAALEQYELFRSPLDLGPQPGRVKPGTRVSYLPSAALVMRTEVIRQAGGFNPAMRVGEDVDLIWRLTEGDRNTSASARWASAGSDSARWASAGSDSAGSDSAGSDSAHSDSAGSDSAVRYEPASVVHHQIRSDLGAWLQQRVSYGSSAAALERAHPGMVAPAVISPWSAAVWGLAATGHLVAASALAIGTTVQLGKKLPELPVAEVVRLGIGGHLGAGRQLARSVQRVWWPVAVPVAVLNRRARSAVLGAVVLTAVGSLRERRSTAPTRLRGRAALGFVGLGLLDDMSYGAGVWLGCLRERSLKALLPSMSRPSGPTPR